MWGNFWSLLDLADTGDGVGGGGSFSDDMDRWWDWDSS
jgi:hypothetical protein